MSELFLYFYVILNFPLKLSKIIKRLRAPDSNHNENGIRLQIRIKIRIGLRIPIKKFSTEIKKRSYRLHELPVIPAYEKKNFHLNLIRIFPLK